MESSSTQRRPDYQFDFEDFENWLLHFRAHGYVVLKGAATSDDVISAKALLWNDIARLTGAFRGFPDTWHKLDGAQVGRTGLNSALAQSAGSWLIRGLGRVKHAFGLIWGESLEHPDMDLLVSMDVVLLWRPWWVNGSWLPKTEGLHLDQNPNRPPRRCGPYADLDCVQGMVPLLPVNAETGGLEVVPDSHVGSIKDMLMSRHPEWEDCETFGDFCMVGDNDPLSLPGPHRQLLHADPGDLILWDIRTVHGGRVGSRPVAAAGAPYGQSELARLACTVAMTPRRFVSEARRGREEVHGDSVLQQRREHFGRGEAMTCFPHRIRTTGQCNSGSLSVNQLPALDPEQRALLGGSPASAEEAFQHYARALREVKPTAATSLACADFAAGGWSDNASMDAVLGTGLEDAQYAVAAVRFLSELVDAGTLSATQVGESLDRLRDLELDDDSARQLQTIAKGLEDLQITS